jgi:hypothetical protein
MILINEMLLKCLLIILDMNQIGENLIGSRTTQFKIRVYTHIIE